MELYCLGGGLSRHCVLGGQFLRQSRQRYRPRRLLDRISHITIYPIVPINRVRTKRMSRWVRVASVADCPPGKSLETVAEDRIVALYNVGGQFHALDGVCPHQGGPLGKGCLTGEVVTCPWHGWQFNVTSGQHTFSPNVRQPRFEVRVEDNDVYVLLD